MPQGRLEVVLIGAKGLDNSDFLDNADPYVILTCRTQEQRSSVVSGQTVPEWNETFVVTISSGVTELGLQIMDKDTFSSDDNLGEATIDLELLFEEGSFPTATYNVVKDQEYRGQIRVSLAFIPEWRRSRATADGNSLPLIEFEKSSAKSPR